MSTYATVSKVRHSGALVVEAMVRPTDGSSGPWLHSHTFLGYTKTEAIAMFTRSLTRDGLEIVVECAND